MKRTLLASTLALLTVATLSVPAASADDVIYGGIDLWRTPGNGHTGINFAASPLPAGFFCPGSKAFTGRVVLRGVPLVTAKAGALPGTDTIFERLDDARFDEQGLASTRVKVRALNLEGVAPLKTECGSYRVRATLAGEQPVTRMKLIRESENGGRFLAPLALDIKLLFEPLAKGARTLEVERSVRFPVNPQLRWSSDVPGNKQFVHSVKVDTDGDKVADTYLRGTSNFSVSHDPTLAVDKYIGMCQYDTVQTFDEPCHCSNGEQHCVE